MSIIISPKWRWRDRLLLFGPPPGRKTQSKRDQLPHLSRLGSQSCPAPIELARRPCHPSSHQSEQDRQSGDDFPVVLSGKIPVHCVPVANFPGQPHHHRQFVASSLTKISVRLCKSPVLDQAWLVAP